MEKNFNPGGDEEQPLLMQGVSERDSITDLSMLSGKSSEKELTPQAKNKLGWFMGVFIPSMLGAYGVIIFLRIGWIVGQAGIYEAGAMLIIAYLVTLLSVFSLAAIATNGKMKGGGTYYLISRALGPEFGGSIGLVFFVANVFGGAFYVIGFADTFANALHEYVPNSRWWIFLYSSVILALMILIIFIGANLYAQSSFWLFIIIFVSLCYVPGCAFFHPPDASHNITGWKFDTLKSNLESHYTPTEGINYDFRTVFAIIFPGITGLIAGSNMSGDLADPGSAIPKGTLWATLVTFLQYVLLYLSLGGSVATSGLLDNYFIFVNVSWFGLYFVNLGILASVVGSGLASLIGASRIIQAIARDNLIKPLAIFGRGYGAGDEPRIGVILTWFLCQCTLFIGSINLLAPFVTLFFMLTFLSTNFACFFLSITGAPNFRPSFKYYHWSLAAFGALLSAAIMFYTDPIKAAVSFIIVVILFFVIHYTAPATQWGDVTQALIYHQVRKYLLRLDIRKDHVKFWRPQILLMTDNPEQHPQLATFLDHLKKGGIYVLGHVMQGNWDQSLMQDIQETEKKQLNFIERAKIKAFSEVTIAPNLRLGCQNLILTSGLGGMKPNTVALGWFGGMKEQDELTEVDQENELDEKIKKQEPISLEEYVYILRDLFTNDLKKNVMITRNFQKYDDQEKAKRYIDCWLIGEADSSLQVKGKTKEEELNQNDEFVSSLSPTYSAMLLFGSIIQRRSRHDELRIFTLDSQEAITIRQLLETYRIEGEVFALTIEAETNQHINDLIASNSGLTRVLFLPLPVPPKDVSQFQNYMTQLNIVSKKLPPTSFVHGYTTVLTDEI